jgi:phosphoribosylaminoimidazolecarboxamide formyltransferase/IMP cyclohydrolase
MYKDDASKLQEKKKVAKIKRALLSVYNKEGIIELARNLCERGVELVSSGGTQKTLQEHKIVAHPISELTGYPEILDGRVKTLHPAVFGGILARRIPEHLAQLKKQRIIPIDLVVVNLYPFEDTINQSDCTLAQAIEKIDIGGPSLLRAAAKNYADITVLVDPGQYAELIKEMDAHELDTSIDFRTRCALRVFQHVSRYDALVAGYLSQQYGKSDFFPEEITVQGIKLQDLRYGENPHQKAAFYAAGRNKALNNFEQLHGKELSYNNILDLDAVLNMIEELKEPATVIIKHNNPCGAAIADSLLESYRLAFASDSVSAYGGIVGLNRPVDAELAKEMSEPFLECILAPDFSPEALDLLTKKKNLRLIRYSPARMTGSKHQIRTVREGFLVQSTDDVIYDIRQSKVVTRRIPSTEELKSLQFAWTMTKHVHSNAIVLVKGQQLIGVGAGQMSRVDSAELAITKAKKAKHHITGAVAGSDAFFPFRDGLDILAAAGVTAIAQPGGSVRDGEVIQAADEHDLAMIFTGIRHFKH